MIGRSHFRVLTSEFVFMFGSGSTFCVRCSRCGAGNDRSNHPPNLNTNQEPRTRKRELQQAPLNFKGVLSCATASLPCCC